MQSGNPSPGSAHWAVGMMRCIAKKTFETAAAARPHLIVPLRDNRLTLHRRVEAVCNGATPLSGVRTVDGKKRNRHESRTVAVFDAAPAVMATPWQPCIAAIIQVERIVLTLQPTTCLWRRSYANSFSLSNRPLDAAQAAEAVCPHWGIESKLHTTRYITLCEDASRVRKNPGVFARIRSFDYTILRFNQSDTIPKDRYAVALGGLKSLFLKTGRRANGIEL